MQVILEEGGEAFSTPGEHAGNDFAFPGVSDSEMQESYGGVHATPAPQEGAAASSSPASYQLSPPNTNVTSPRSMSHTNNLSTGTLPSQSLTGLLAGANDLIGEMGTSGTANLTGALSQTTVQHSVSTKTLNPSSPENAH